MIKKWGVFELGELFHIQGGKNISEKTRIKGVIPYIGSSSKNNGITDFVSNKNNTFSCNFLSLNSNGVVGECFYQAYPCLVSGDVKRLFLKNKIGNERIYLFLKACILQQKEKYSYGYKFNENRIDKQKIKIPITKNNHPDYEYIESYIFRLKEKNILKI